MLIRWKNQNPSNVTPNSPNYAKWGVAEAFPIVAHGFSTLVTTIVNSVYIAGLIRDYRESENYGADNMYPYVLNVIKGTPTTNNIESYTFNKDRL